MSALKTTLLDTIRVLESCEAKLEYMGNHRVGTRDAPDCLHRAAKARNAIATLRSAINEHFAAQRSPSQEKP